MAYVSDFEQELQQGATQAPTSAPTDQTITSGQSAFATGGDSEQAAGNSGGSGTGWTNLSTYLDANKSQSADMGQKVAGDVQENIQGFNDTTQDWANQATGEIQSGTAQGYSGTAPISGMDENTFDAYNTASYQGPKTYETSGGYGNVQQAGDAFGNLNQQTKSFEGVGGLIKDSYGRDSYTRGENIMDTFLVNSSDAGQQALQGIQGQYETYGQNVADTGANLTGQIQGGIDASNLARDQFQAQTITEATAEQAARDQRLADQKQQANDIRMWQDAADAEALASFNDQNTYVSITGSSLDDPNFDDPVAVDGYINPNETSLPSGGKYV